MPAGAKRFSLHGRRQCGALPMHERLADLPREFDVVIIGGGINGAGVARDAALRGFRVALVEQYDFGSGSSSRTSKLVHGGIRYLEHGALRLVWEASRERRRLLRLAPHLVRPLPFVFPVYAGGRVGMWRLRAGMWLYDLLAAFRNVRRHRVLSMRHADRWTENLRRDGLRGGALYYDAAMNDARLVGAGCVVACTGVWTNALLAAIPGTQPAVAPTRGTHIVVRRLGERAFTLAAERDGRVFFVLPWGEGSLVGTTDVEDQGRPEAVEPTEAEIEYLLSEANRFFPAARLGRQDVVAAFAGLRPLLRASGAASARGREHAILQPVPGLIAVVGGKYTTYRAVAEAVVDRIEQSIGRRGACRTRNTPLPGGDLAWSPEEHWGRSARFQARAAALAVEARVEPAVAARWLAVHGTRAAAIAALAAAEPAPLAVEPTVAPGMHVKPHPAEVVHAIRHELALHLEDWFVRRSGAAFEPGNGIADIEAVAAIFSGELAWDTATRDAEITACRSLLAGIGARNTRGPT
jgi:glycerol-3-phosphate dehydrogenase